MTIEQLESQFQNSIDDLQGTWDKIVNQLKNSQEGLKTEIEKLQSEKQELQEKYEDAQNKIDRIEGQLEDTLEQLQSITNTSKKGIDAMKLLDIYLVLMDRVFESQAHTRLLIMLHGEKEEYTLNELSKAAGIPPLRIKQAIFELRNTGVVNFDEEKQIVELKTRFMN